MLNKKKIHAVFEDKLHLVDNDNIYYVNNIPCSWTKQILYAKQSFSAYK